MSYSENKEEINKVFQINSLNNRGRFFLRTEDYEKAKECFLGVLEIDEENMDAIMSLFLLERGFKSVDQAVEYYRNLFTIEKTEKIEACEYETELIEQFMNEYAVEGYLSKEEIEELFKYDEDLTYESKLKGYEKQKELIEEEINKNISLSKLSKSQDPQAKEIIGRILEPYDAKIEEARNADQYAKIKVATNYRRFIEKQSEEVRQLSKNARERKDNDYNAAIELFYQAEEIDDFERAIEIFRSFEGYKEADEYIKNCQEKIDDIKSRQKAIENQNKVRELLKETAENLKNKEFEKADELYFEVISIDSENNDAYLGTLLAENEISNRDELSNIYFKTDYAPVKIKAISESTDTIEKYADKYYLPNYLEKEDIKRLFSYADFEFDSYLESVVKKKDELKKEFERNQAISWLMDHENPFITGLYQELNDKYDKQIEEFKEKDELETVNKTIKYQRFLKNSIREAKQKYENALKKKEEDYQNAREVLNTSKSVKEIKDIKKTLNNLGDYKDSQDLLFEALTKIEELKIVEKEEEFKKELNSYIEEAKQYLKEDRFEDADLLFQKVYSFDDENVDARIGLLMVENNCHDIVELIEKYKEIYSTEQFNNDCELVNGKSMIDSHIQAMADEYSVPGKLERSVIINLYNNEDIFYRSIVSKLEELQETLNDDIGIDENLSWLCEHEDNQIASLFKQLDRDIQKAIKNAKKEDIANQKKIKEEFKIYARHIDEAVIDLYKKIKKPVEEEEEVVKTKEEPTTLDELASLHKLNLEVEPLEIPTLKKEEEEDVKKEEEKAEEPEPVREEKTVEDVEEETEAEEKGLKFNILGLFNSLKENKEKEEEKKLAEEQERIRVEEAMRARFLLEMEEEERSKAKEKEIRERLEAEREIEKLNKQEEEKAEFIEPKPFVIQRPRPVQEEEKPVEQKTNVSENNEPVKESEQPEETNKQAEDKKPVKKEKPKKEKKPKKERTADERRNSRILFIMGAIIIIMAGLVMGIVYKTVIQPNNLYNEALALTEAQQYDQAIEIFEKLGDYKDSAQMINDAYFKKATALYEKDDALGALGVLKNLGSDESKARIKEIKDKIINNAKVGDTIIFGEYEQDGDRDNGREYIEWEVLDIEDNKLLIISKYCLDVQKYNDTSETTDWKSSSIRSWLNGRFAANAFDSEDPAKVVITNLISVSNEEVEEDQITNDRIFLLGSEDVEKYYPQESDRMCQAAASLQDSNLFIDGNGNCSWWLRDGIAESDYSALIVDSSGMVMNSMYEISNAVRPVMWITK